MMSVCDAHCTRLQKETKKLRKLNGMSLIQLPLMQNSGEEQLEKAQKIIPFVSEQHFILSLSICDVIQK